MRIALVHGYLLRGTGSNLYVQNLCRELCHLGHDVILFCQEPDTREFDFVASAAEFDHSNLGYQVLYERATSFKGKCAFFRPNLRGFLPVYVYDRYEGYQVKELTQLNRDEIEHYLEMNRLALATVFTSHKPDLILTNHTIMQPVYTARAIADAGMACPHFITVHGSCLNFSVRKSALLQEYALEAISAADKIIFLSNFSRQEFSDFFDDVADLNIKAVVIPAGVDVKKFSPLIAGENKDGRINLLVTNLRQSTKNGKGRTANEKERFAEAVAAAKTESEIAALINDTRNKTDNWSTDRDAPETLAAINWPGSQILLYYGKYLWTKGIQLLIAAAPLVLQKNQDTYFVLVGFGSQRGYLEALAAALEYGRRDLFCDLLAHPDKYDSEVEPASARYFAVLLEKLRDKKFSDVYFNAAYQNISKRIVFTGYMNHDDLSNLIPCSDITLATSIFPESFGMVAVEALASGIIPIQTNHSGFADMIRDYVDEIRDTFDATRLKPLLLNKQLAIDLAGNINVQLGYYQSMSPARRQELRQRAQRITLDKYSWNSMAGKYISLYQER